MSLSMEDFAKEEEHGGRGHFSSLPLFTYHRVELLGGEGGRDGLLQDAEGGGVSVRIFVERLLTAKAS